MQVQGAGKKPPVMQSNEGKHAIAQVLVANLGHFARDIGPGIIAAVDAMNTAAKHTYDMTVIHEEAVRAVLAVRRTWKNKRGHLFKIEHFEHGARTERGRR